MAEGAAPRVPRGHVPIAQREQQLRVVWVGQHLTDGTRMLGELADDPCVLLRAPDAADEDHTLPRPRSNALQGCTSVSTGLPTL